jgi:hypothetical protein
MERSETEGSVCTEPFFAPLIRWLVAQVRVPPLGANLG